MRRRLRRARRSLHVVRHLGGLLARRLRHGPAQPHWSLPYELVVGVVRQRFHVDLPVAAARKGMEAVPAPGALRGLGWREERVGGVPCAWVEPPSPSERVVVFLHGGAYAVGSPRSHRPLLGALARTSRARVLAVDYRLAPEHPCPAAIDDAVAVVRALLDRGVAPERLHLVGDSAGGGLSLTTLLALRDLGLPLPRSAVLLSPWTDLTISGPPPDHAHLDYLPPGERLHVYAERYAGALDRADPRVSPLFADLAGLPPLLVLAGGAERILHDSTRLAERARAAGVDVTLHVEPGEIHVYPMFVGLSPAAWRGIRQIADFLR